MAYSPVELRHIRPKRSLFGYRPDEVDRILEDVAASFEEVWRDRADLRDRVEELESDLTRYRQNETLLHTTLTAAESAAVELKEQAQRDVQLVIDEARLEAQRITLEARIERDRLSSEARRIRALLGAALDAIEDAEHASESAPGSPEAQAA
jgi:cell division initiation protein